MKSSHKSRSFKWLLAASLLFSPVSGLSGQADAAGAYTDKLVLQQNSKVMVHNGRQTLAQQPLTAIKGVSYLPLKSIASLYGYKVGYNASSREATATLGGKTIRFKLNSADVWVGSDKVKANGATMSQNGSTMVPVRTWAQITGSRLSVSGGSITLQWSTLPQADFAVWPSEIIAGKTQVTYLDRSYHPGGLNIVNERWENRQTVFSTPGQYVVTRWVQDERGQWSEPYSVTVTVKAPNQPPEAYFTTDKSVYRIGEKIEYHDLSTDDRNDIVSRKWSGNEPAFFEPGEKLITLEVTDGEGLTDRITKSVYISDEVLYTKEEFDQLFTPAGEKYGISGGSVLQIPSVPYTFKSEKAQMVRSNSPETWLEEGIAYDDQLSGNVRFLFHNLNKIGRNVNMYLVATNINSTTAKVGTSSYGSGGPTQYVSTAGKLATDRYMQSLVSKPATEWTTLKPGESKVIMHGLHSVPIKPNQVFSAYGDVVTDKLIRFRVVVLDPAKDPVQELDSLSVMPRDGLHVRGTFYEANRELVITEPLGYEPKRVVLGDRKMDTYLSGIDGTTGRLELNLGNFGVLYHMNLEVAPRTLIALNARGGHYAGSFIINGQVVPVTKNSILKNQNEAAVLYRTGNSPENVSITFTLASGSNLPVAMLFLPMPEERR